MVTSARRAQLILEASWWGFALILAALVVLPIYGQVPDYPFLVPNFVFVVVAITLTRYLFFLHISWLRDRLLLQGAVIIVLIPLVFWMVQCFNEFITYLDEEGPDVLVRHLERDWGRVMNTYIQGQYRFFGVWAVVAAFVTPFRLLYNIWVRYRAQGRR